MATTFATLFIMHILTNHAKTDCLSSCTACKTAPSCMASIDRGNRCKWEDAICQEIITSNFNRFQIIPLPGTTETGATLEDKQECICNEAYFSSWINTEESCDCYHGMKALRVQYTGTTTIASITFYHNSYRHYEDCIFTDVEPNDIIQCTSFPYSQFVSTVHIKVNGVHECKTSIDTTCSANILDTVPTDCDMLRIVGWIDEAGYVCKAPQLQTATLEPSETGNSNKVTPKNRKTSGTRGGHRRRLDSSSASSSGYRKPWGRLFRRKTTKTPSTSSTPSPSLPLYLTTTPLPTEAEEETTPAPSHHLPLYLTTTPLLTQEPTENDAEEETTTTTHLPLYLTTTPLSEEDVTTTSTKTSHLPLYLTTTPLSEEDTTTTRTKTSHLPLYLTTTPLPEEEVTTTGTKTSQHMPLYMTTTPLPADDTTTTQHIPLYMTTTELPEEETTSTSQHMPLYMTTTPLTDTPSPSTMETTSTTDHIPLYMTTTPLPTEYDIETTDTTTTRKGASGSVPTIQPTETEESTTVESTEYDDELESTSSTSTATESTVYTTRTTIFKEAYCECASAESWDDYHYLDENGDVVTLSRQNEAAVIVNTEEVDDNDADEVNVPMLNGEETIEMLVGEYNPMLMNKGNTCSYMHVVCGILLVSYLMM